MQAGCHRFDPGQLHHFSESLRFVTGRSKELYDRRVVSRRALHSIKFSAQLDAKLRRMNGGELFAFGRMNREANRKRFDL